MRIPTTRLTAGLVLAFVLAACSDSRPATTSGGTGGGNVGGGGNNGGGTAGGPGTIPRLPPPRLNFPLDSRTPGTIRAVRAFPNLTFTDPVQITHAPDNSNRIFVVCRDGRVFVFPNDNTVTQPSVFLDIRSRVNNFWEEGLLGLAFDPNYSTNGYFYVNYIESSQYDTIISRFRVSAGNANQADPGSESLLLRIDQPQGNHNGGCLAFGPDRMLYIALGDGGGQGDPNNNGQNLNTLLAKILRIDVSRTSGSLPYAIPADNPMVGVPNAREETWAYGLRNPWRFSFDRQTGDLWAGDVGQDTWEEIDLIVRGGNYDWPRYEGNANFRNPNSLPQTRRPVHVLPRNEASSIIGGHVYRGSGMPSLQGAYIYGDFQSGNVWALRHNNGQMTSNQVIGYVNSISSFGEDQAGEIYICALYSGQIFKLEEQGGSGGGAVPTVLSATGLLQDTASLTWADGVIPFEVNSPLWSDGAKKSRYYVLPDGYITFSATDPWTFPVGTVTVKHFEMELIEGQPSSTKRLETRVFVHERAGWAGYTYRWNAAQTDADLLTTGASETLTIRDRSGAVRQQPWSYPSRTDCLQCHTQASGHVLGLRTLQANRWIQTQNAWTNQIDLWNAMSMFDVDINGAHNYPRLPDPSDTSASVQDRARSYLDANCSSCHRPNGAMGGGIDLRYQTTNAAMNVIDVRPTRGDLGLPDAYRIKRQVPGSSVLWERLRRLDGTRMPALGTHVIDAPAIALLQSWISTL